MWRYQGGRSEPAAKHLHAIAGHLFPIDAELAEAIALASGATLESLGLVPPPPQNAPSPAPPAPLPVDPKQARLLVDAIVCAAAESLDVSPRSVRAVLYAAFARAKETGLSIEVIEKALAGLGARAAKPPRRGVVEEP